MAGKKSKAKPPRPDEAHAGETRFFRVHTDMLESPAYKDLSPMQKILLIHCKNEAHGRAQADEKKRTGKPAAESLFYMNRGLYVSKFNLYSEGNYKGFRRDMAALIEHGFVDCVRSGYSERTQSLYRLSGRWKSYGSSGYKVPEEVKTNFMRGDNYRAG